MTDRQFAEGRGEMEEILQREAWGCLGLCADGQAYVAPVNYSYADGRIVFHCAPEGRKLDCIRSNPNVCFTVASQSGEVREHPGGKACHVDSGSVICFGEARIVENLHERAGVLNAFNRAFRPEAQDLSPESVAGCTAVEIRIREMTGRREGASRRTFWRASF